jgi:small subunit ribosomal protein S2
MPRKKTTEEKQVENIEEKKEIAETAEVQDSKEEKKEIESESEKPKKKKKEIKKLSETELKRVMTDTKETLVPLTDYIACSVHLGTKVITPDMRKFVYKRRADGLAVLNTNIIDDKLREAIKLLKDFSAEDIFIVCKRESCWPAVEKFAEVTGIRRFTKKYPAGIITNLQLENFFEAKLVIVCDPWVDKNALNDATKLKLNVLGICDTNNYAAGVSQIIPANNKSRKSVGLILFILAKEYLKAQGKEEEAKSINLEDFAGKIEEPEQRESGREGEGFVSQGFKEATEGV